MVEPVSLAALAVGLLAPYLTKTAEGFATRTGAALADKAADKVGALYQVLRKQFNDDPYAEQTLDRVEEKPDSEERRAALQGVLAEKIESDPDLAETVNRLVKEAEAARAESITQTVYGDRNVFAGRDIAGSTINTGDRNEAGNPNN